ncbi:hypothetical protein [Pelosinus sp. IPA-1]|uniref:hypothetical protein n=1 Tax=Pelosinus sp. IPA-1 TaxID=3029569 RepID=UPI0024362469|nr:hypothetical protein [Pelosinus sp. IPA-1]GMA98353.1 hypothetical protein PIPA1_11530 [Pelosinus sp. IPA-1]
MSKSKCRCGSTIFETVDITPFGMEDKRFFTRCSKCGLVVVGSNDPSERKSDSKCSILHFVRNK